MVLTITKCYADDCKNRNKNNGDCIINHEFTKSGCLQYGKDMEYLNQKLKEYLKDTEKIRGNKIELYPKVFIENRKEIDDKLDRKEK